MLPTPIEIILGISGALVICFIAWKMKALSASGAIAAFFLGGTIFIFGGIEGAVILMAFFVSGSLLSRLTSPSTNVEGDRGGGSGRNYRQVLANGIAPLIGVLLTTFKPEIREQATLFFLGSLATATADTWATELGMRYGKDVYHIFTFRKIQKGLSGGVSLAGLAASVCGAALIAVLPYIVFWEGNKLCGLVLVHIFPIVLIAGISGALLDSIIGAALQVKYITEDGHIIEEKIPGARFRSGIPIIGNNATNLISTIWGGLIAAGLMNL